MQIDALALNVVDAGEDCLVTCEGVLDRSTASRFRETVDAILDLHPERIYLDCTLVSEIDSTGVGSVMHVVLACRSKGIVLTAGLNETLRRVFDPIGVGALISVNP